MQHRTLGLAPAGAATERLSGGAGRSLVDAARDHLWATWNCDPDAKVWFHYDPSPLVTRGESVEVHNVMLHMHELGSIGRVAVLRKDGSTDSSPASCGSSSAGGWSLTAGAAAGYRIAESGGAIIDGVHAAAPVIGGVDLGRHQLVVSLTGGFQRWYSSGARRVDIPFVGESIGFVWQIGRRWALLPEAGAWTPGPNFMTETSRLFHVGIAALWTR